MIDESYLTAADDLFRRLAAAAKAVHLYAPDHPVVRRTSTLLAETVDQLLTDRQEFVMGILDGQLVLDGHAGFSGPGATEAMERLSAAGVARIAITRGVTHEELADFVRQLPVVSGVRAGAAPAPVPGTVHIRVSRLLVERPGETRSADVRALRRSYADSVARVEALWVGAVASGRPDPLAAAEVIDGLAELLGQNRRALIALTALSHYDDYTFTHQVNVGILTMAQASAVGIEGEKLRQFGIAGLMHDIGKIRIPSEILTKPAKLTDAESAIMRRHPVEGADILRRQIEMPPLAAIVAFEHHLRMDGKGYPEGVRRPALNIATQFCAIADVYDAMRSQRTYQQAFPPDRILAVLRQGEDGRFDPRLVRRFSQLMGIYPPGTVVRLDDGSLAVVVRVHAPEPARPAVQIVVRPDGTHLDTPVEVALWEEEAPGRPYRSIVTPVDPVEVGIDPLPYLQAA